LNDPGLTESLHGFASGTIGAENIHKTLPMMGGEDFAEYGRTPEKIPICMIWVGCTEPNLMKTLKERGEKPFPLHSSYFSPDYEKTIETGIKVMVGNVIGLTGN
jgi:hippurate hydrolase